MTSPRPTQVASLTPTEIDQIVAEAFGHSADRQLLRTLEAPLLDAGEGGADWIARHLDSNPTVTRNSRALRQLRELREPKLLGINRTTGRQLKRKLSIAAQETDVKALRKEARRAVREVFRTAHIARAGHIAVAETGVFWHTGGHAQMDELGTPAGIWTTMQDDRVRDSHMNMNGQCRPVGHAFVSGEGNRLRYPHDPAAPMSETAGCRCVIWPQARGCPDDEGLVPGYYGASYRQRATYWKAAMASIGTHERVVRGAMRRVFKAQRLVVGAALERALRD